MTPSRPCTMTDVARRAGVHPATVSRALRDDPRITLAQRKKVQRAAAELGYRTNPLIAALMSARRAGHGPTYQATLAYVTDVPPDRRAWFDRDFGELLVGARTHAESKGYHLEELNLHPLATHAPRATEILLARGIHGLMIAPLYSVDEPVAIDWSHFATVAFGYSFTQATVSRVAHNTFGGYLLAAHHGRAAGRRRIGLVLQRRVHEKVEKRWLAAALLDQSEHPARDRVPPLLLDGLDGRAFGTWYGRHRPDVIICVDTGPILGCLKALGRRVPRDTAVVGLDRRPRDRGIAGVNQDYARLGAAAIDLLVSLLNRNARGRLDHPVTVHVDGDWVAGRSLGRPPR